jgi:hypothetical protein
LAGAAFFAAGFAGALAFFAPFLASASAMTSLLSDNRIGQHLSPSGGGRSVRDDAPMCARSGTPHDMRGRPAPAHTSGSTTRTTHGRRMPPGCRIHTRKPSMDAYDIQQD